MTKKSGHTLVLVPVQKQDSAAEATASDEFLAAVAMELVQRPTLLFATICNPMSRAGGYSANRLRQFYYEGCHGRPSPPGLANYPIELVDVYGLLGGNSLKPVSGLLERHKGFLTDKRSRFERPVENALVVLASPSQVAAYAAARNVAAPLSPQSVILAGPAVSWRALASSELLSPRQLEVVDLPAPSARTCSC